MAPSTGPGDTTFKWNPESRTASRLARAMLERDESVNSLAKKLFNGQRKTVHRFLEGKTISQPNREKLAAHLGVNAEELAPDDVLADLRPLLERAEELRRQRGLRLGTIVAELARLAARPREHPEGEPQRR